MIEIPVALDRTFRLDAPLDAAFALLADVEAWASMFPRVQALDPLPDHGPDAWRWTMEPLGPPGFEAQTVYGCQYAIGAGTVAWTPLAGVGNARFAGRVALEADGDATRGTLALDTTLEIPAPRFARAVVRPAVAFEMGRMTDTFLDRVRERLA